MRGLVEILYDVCAEYGTDSGPFAGGPVVLDGDVYASNRKLLVRIYGHTRHFKARKTALDFESLSKARTAVGTVTKHDLVGLCAGWARPGMVMGEDGYGPYREGASLEDVRVIHNCMFDSALLSLGLEALEAAGAAWDERLTIGLDETTLTVSAPQGVVALALVRSFAIENLDTWKPA